jgi:hypothetical protein
MKRLMILVMVLSVLTPVFAIGPVLGVIGVGLDIVTTKHSTTLIIDGEEITIGGSSIKGLQKSMDQYDFSTLNFDERLSIYENAQVSIGWPVAKGLLLGFGSGSKAQGDIGGKIFGEIADWTALATIGIGLTTYIVEFIVIAPWLGDQEYPKGTEMQQIAKGFLIGGAIGFGVERIIQAILPAVYGNKHNKVLRDNLGITKDGQDSFTFNVGMVPVVDREGSVNLGMQVGARLSF